MSIIYNSVSVASVNYGQTDVNKGYYHSVEVFTKEAQVVLYPAFSVQTQQSRVPPPYDENGYNYNDSAPVRWADETVEIDVTSYDSITFSWNNEGTYNGWGGVHGYYEFNSGSRIELFDGAQDHRGEVTIDTSEISGTISLKFIAYAHSQSSYGGNVSGTTLNIGDILGNL